MRVRYPLAGLFLVLELPVLLTFAAGALVAAILRVVAVLCPRTAHAIGRFLRGSGYRLHVTFDEPRREFLRGSGHRLRITSDGRGKEFLRDRGYRLLVAFDERGPEWVLLALGLAAAVALGALIAG